MTLVREMLTTLEQKIYPQWTALLVIDMQNDFCAEGGAFYRSEVNVLPLQAPAKPIIRLVEDAHQVNVPVIFIRNVYNTPEGWYLSDVILEQARRGGHGRYYTISMCERDSWGDEFFEGIRPGKSDLVVVKHRFNAFFNTDLDLVLRNKGVRTVIACGVLTNVCVESAVRDAYIRDYYVVVPSDCVGARDEEFQRASLRTIATSFGQIVVSEDVRQV